MFFQGHVLYQYTLFRQPGERDMDKERYHCGSHTVTDSKYYFVGKTKYSYGDLRHDVR